jgi:monofunctional biosynthetic peptidoglycan transglycosylase
MGSRQRRRQGVRKRRYRSRRTLHLRRARRLKGLAIACLAPLILTAALVLPWRWIDPPGSAFMLRERAVDGAEVQNDWVALHEIADALILCVLAAEDQKFPTHRGFDFASIAEALEEDGAKGRGASTISQQVAKNLYLWRERSWVRKGLEAYFTIFIEALWPKRRILEVYLNVAEFGPSVFGAAAASRHFYGKHPIHLTHREAAHLAAVLPNPKERSPTRPSPYVSERAGRIAQAAHRLAGTRLAELIR